MLFNSLQFAIFLAVVVFLDRRLSRRGRSGLLLASSLLFYSLWYPAYTILLLANMAVNYALIRAIERSPRPRVWLVSSIVFTLGVLATFKYLAFFSGALGLLSEPLLGWSPPMVEFVLPLGISFLSFQLLGLAIDVYHRKIKPPQTFGRYALFVSFFPQLIAGPIMRGRELLPQLEKGGTLSPERTRRGVWLLATGLGKKTILADFLLAPYADAVFGTPEAALAPMQLVGVYCFAFQIYFDFSGYTDMARGIACLLGFELPLNFKEPYLSRSPVEFWRRWHITLSEWLRDYLYVPLGGNRRGRERTYLNLFLTMLLGGLWHGAGWNFLIWGGMHGLWLAGHRLIGRPRPGGDREPGLRDLPAILLTFHGVALLWIFFRAPTFAGAMTAVETIFTGPYNAGAWPVLQVGIVLLCVALQILERVGRLHFEAIRRSLGGVLGGVIEGAALGTILAVAASGVGGEFIYFQF